MQGQLLSLICAVALARGVLSNVDPFFACSRACNACNCLPTEPLTICSPKEAEGILLPHEHCNKFYICNHGSKVTFDCSGDLLFNPLTDQCDFAHNVVCGDRVIPEKEDQNEESEDNNDNSDNENENNNGDNENNSENSNCNCNPDEAPLICAGSGSDGTLVAHEVCNRYFICNNGVPTTMKCPKGLLYNPYIERCDWPYNVECGDREIVEGEEDNNENSENGDSSNENGDDNNSNVGTCNCDPAEAPSICSNEGSDGILVAHEICCNFYICNHGVPVTKRCPFGLLYNPHTEKCDWPRNVNCDDRDQSEEEEVNGGHGEEDSSDENSDNDVTEEPQPEIDLFEIAKTKCADIESEGRMAIHQNCHQFYVCLKHEPALLSCPLGLYFDADKHTCEWRQNVQCGSRI